MDQDHRRTCASNNGMDHWNESFLPVEQVIQILLRNIEDGISGRNRLTGHPFGQAVVDFGKAGAAVELTLNFQGLTTQHLQDIGGEYPSRSGR